MRSKINISTKELDELEEFVSDFYAPVRMLKANGNAETDRFGAVGDISQFGDVTFERTRTIGDFEIIPLTEHDAPMFKFCKKGGVRFEMSNGGFDSGSGTSMAFSRPKSLTVHDGTEHSTVSIGKQLILRRLTAMLDRPAVPDIAFHQAPLEASPKLKSLSGFVHQWFELPLLDLGRSFPEKSESLANLIADSFLLAYPHNYNDLITGPVPSVSPRHVKRALDYIHSNPHLHTPPEYLAQLSNVSMRSLQYSFRATTGKTITEYQMELRLAGARRQLLHEPHVSITEIARQWGFGSLARFGQTFKSAYGETPSSLRSRS